MTNWDPDSVIHHRIGICGSIETIYHALADPASLALWWASEARIVFEDKPRLILDFTGLESLSFNLNEDKRNYSVRLTCVKGPKAWLDSELQIALQEDVTQVFVSLNHTCLDPDHEEYIYFCTKWPVYLISLKDYIEKGKGYPYPDDIKIYIGE
jgi:hypothetical protein